MAKKPTVKKDAAPKKPSLDIFVEMAEADKRNTDFLEGLDPELAKTFAPLVAMRWFSAVGDRSGLADYYIMMTNELVNIGFWDIYKHPELQWKLMAAAGSGQVQRHQWIPMVKKRNTNKLDALILKLHPSLNDDELDILKQKMTRDSLKQLLRDLALSDADMKPILDDFKKLDHGST